jgi:hypothetical protein
VPKFRKRPVVVEAMHFDSESAGNAIVRWAGGAVTGVFDDGSGAYLTVLTLNGPVRVPQGEHVIRGVENEFYPCADAIFAVTYESVEEEPVDAQEVRNERIAAAAIAYGRASTEENKAALMALLERP